MKVPLHFLIRTVSLLLVTLSSVALASDPINDAKRLRETITAFSEALGSADQNPPPLFGVSVDEFRKLVLNIEPKATDQEIQKRFDKHQSRVNYRYSELKRDLGEIKGVVSFDTVSFVQERAKLINVLLTVTVVDRWDKQEKNRNALITFLIIDNRLKLSGSMRTISWFHYTLDEMETVNNTRSSQIRKKSPHNFESSVENVIPFEKKGKFGLISLTNKVILPPVYDSIFPFVSDYYRVRIKGKYNLLDKDFKAVFAEPKTHIKLEGRMFEQTYWVADKPGQYKSFPFAASSEEMIETPIMEETVSKVRTSKSPRQILYDQLSKQNSDRDYEIVRSRYPETQPEVHWVIRNGTRDTLSTHKGFEFIDPHGAFLCGRKNDSTFILTPTGKINFKSHYVCKYESPGYVIIFNRSTRLFGAYCPFTNIYIEPKYAYIRPVDRDRFFLIMTAVGKVGYLDGEGKKLFDDK